MNSTKTFALLKTLSKKGKKKSQKLSVSPYNFKRSLNIDKSTVSVIINKMIEKLYQLCEYFGLKDYELKPEELRDINLIKE